MKMKHDFINVSVHEIYVLSLISSRQVKKNEEDDEDDEKKENGGIFCLIENLDEQKSFSFRLNEYYYVRLYPKNLMGVFKNP